MGDGSRIEWTDATWNPIHAKAKIPYGRHAGISKGKKKKGGGRLGWFCIHASEGCRNCYAEKMNGWRGNGLEYTAANLFSALLELNLGRGQSSLDWPVRARRPRKIFPCSMTDLFGEFMPRKFVDDILAVCWLASHHTFQLVTKRADRARDYLLDAELPARLADAACRIEGRLFPVAGGVLPFEPPALPLKNVWVGASIEDQANAERRREPLAAIAAAGWLAWVSYEPALGPVDWSGFEFIRWLVAGGESGKAARPAHISWFLQTHLWCAAHGVPFFFKQWGEWLPMKHAADAMPGAHHENCDTRDFMIKGKPCNCRRGAWLRAPIFDWPGLDKSVRVGRRKAGALLGGREWREFPNGL